MTCTVYTSLLFITLWHPHFFTSYKRGGQPTEITNTYRKFYLIWHMFQKPHLKAPVIHVFSFLLLFPSRLNTSPECPHHHSEPFLPQAKSISLQIITKLLPILIKQRGSSVLRLTMVVSMFCPRLSEQPGTVVRLAQCSACSSLRRASAAGHL